MIVTALRKLGVVLLLLTQTLLVGGKAPAISKKDLAGIGCDVCEAAIREVASRVQGMPPHVTFEQIERMFDFDVCDTVRVDSWIRKLDIVLHEGNRSLGLVPGSGISLCGAECATIRHKCSLIMDEDMDKERVVDYLKTKRSKSHLNVEEAVATVCKDWTKVCPSKRTLPSGETRQDEVFLPMEAALVQRERDEQYSSMREVAEKKGATAIFCLADDMKGARAKLYFMEKFIGNLDNSRNPQRHQTYLGHQWKVKINGKVVKQWVVGVEPVQFFILTWADISDNKTEL